MGRTVPTFVQLIQQAAERWKKFRGALRREHHEHFDRLVVPVRYYTHAATYQCHDNPMEAILLSIALDQEKRLGWFRPAPSLILREGSSSRRLAFWPLEHPVRWVGVNRGNRRIAHRLRAPKKHSEPENLWIPAPGTCLRVGRTPPSGRLAKSRTPTTTGTSPHGR